MHLIAKVDVKCPICDQAESVKMHGLGMLMLLHGKPIPDNRADVPPRLDDHIHENKHSNSYEDGMFAMKYFQKGTAHITFKRS